MTSINNLLDEYRKVKLLDKENNYMKIVSYNYELLLYNSFKSKQELIIKLNKLKKNLINLKNMSNDSYYQQHLNKEISNIKKIITEEELTLNKINKILLKYNGKKKI